MCDKMELKNVFYACVIPFLIFFASFALFMYPARGLIHPHGIVDALANHLPAGFSAPLAIVRNWSFALFYVMAEMWGSVVTSLLFWGFANEVTTVDEAKKYCTLLTDMSGIFKWRQIVPYIKLPPCLLRSFVWDGGQRRLNFFRTIRQMGFEDEGDPCPWSRCLGGELEVFDGCCRWQWGRPTCGIQVHARQNCVKERGPTKY